MAIKEVSERYLELRQNALDYTFEQMNLQLENDKQVYLAVFDIPVESAIIGNKNEDSCARVWIEHPYLLCKW